MEYGGSASAAIHVTSGSPLNPPVTVRAVGDCLTAATHTEAVALAIMAEAWTSGHFDSLVETNQMSFETDAGNVVSNHSVILLKIEHPTTQLLLHLHLSAFASYSHASNVNNLLNASAASKCPSSESSCSTHCPGGRRVSLPRE